MIHTISVILLIILFGYVFGRSVEETRDRDLFR